MKAPVKTILGTGINAHGTIIDVECSFSNSLPNIVIVGFASKSVDEAKERIRGALASSNIRLPRKRITINLAPADVPKEGSSFDLAMVISIFQAGEMISQHTNDCVVIGELGLDGSVRAVRGIIGKILSAKKLGYSKFIIPKSNLDQASLIPGISLVTVTDLTELFNMLQKPELVFSAHSSEGQIKLEHQANETEDNIHFEDVTGQERAKRALVIAAAGNHNIFLNGPPGTGKSMLAKAMQSIMPSMSVEEMLEVTHLHSLANKDFDRIISERPVRSPHHTSSQISIIGGGSYPKPGEISLSHKGILFFDEFPEFNRSVVEALRQPLEDKKVSVARAKDSIDFPADFILVATANPCPCGNYDTSNICSCSPSDINRYQKRISGPVLDRIDLFVDVDEVEHNKLLSSQKSGLTSERLRLLVKNAREIQHNRQGILNGHLSSKKLKSQKRLNEEAENLFNKAAKQMRLSPRSYMRTLKVASTIADLNSEDAIGINEISEALQYRKKPIEL